MVDVEVEAIEVHLLGDALPMKIVRIQHARSILKIWATKDNRWKVRTLAVGFFQICSYCDLEHINWETLTIEHLQ